MKATLSLTLACAFVSCAAPAETRVDAANPVELGAVRWHRNLEVADAEARRRDDPLLVLFQEVPG